MVTVLATQPNPFQPSRHEWTRRWCGGREGVKSILRGCDKAFVAGTLAICTKLLSSTLESRRKASAWASPCTTPNPRTVIVLWLLSYRTESIESRPLTPRFYSQIHGSRIPRPPTVLNQPRAGLAPEEHAGDIDENHDAHECEVMGALRRSIILHRVSIWGRRRRVLIILLGQLRSSRDQTGPWCPSRAL